MFHRPLQCKKTAKDSGFDQTLDLIRRKVQVFEEVDIDRISEFVTMTSDELERREDAGDLLRAGFPEDYDSDEANLLQGASDGGAKVNLEAQMAAASLMPMECDQDNNWLASFLQDNLILSDLNLAKNGEQPTEGAVNSQ